MDETRLWFSVFYTVAIFICIGAVKDGKAELKLAFDEYLPSNEKYIDVPPIILIHGLTDSRATWKPIAPTIANETGRKIYAFDLRNHGESPWVDELNFDLVADDLNDFMNQHDIPKAILVGHSMGGKGALTFALRKPERVEKLITEDIPVSNITIIPQGLAILLLRLLRRSLDIIPPGTDQKAAQKIFLEFVQKKIPNSFIPCQMSNFDLLPIKVSGGRYTWKLNLDAIESSVMVANGVLYEQDFSSYDAYPGETLFIYGTKSAFNVDKDELVLKYFPRAVKLGFEGATHLIHQEFREDYIRETVHFINGRINPTKTKCDEE